jgi:hypothetical protein
VFALLEAANGLLSKYANGLFLLHAKGAVLGEDGWLGLVLLNSLNSLAEDVCTKLLARSCCLHEVVCTIVCKNAR